MKKNKDNGKFTVVDLFCGVGGFSEGFKQAGYKILAGIDSVDTFIKTFKRNHKGAIGICGDIRELSVEDMEKMLGDREIDVVVGGPPCQGFSIAGRRDPKDPRNSLFMEFVRIVKGFKAKYIVMENVRGLLSMRTVKGDSVVEIIQNEFKRIGYEMEYKVLLAADFGVPQKRYRVIFIGTNTKNRITFPEPTHSKNPEDTLFRDNIKKWVPVKDVLLAREEVGESFFHSERMIEGFKRRKERHRARGNGFGWQILRTDEPSFTISARYWKDGSDALVKYSDSEIRMLTSLECARIQSFPDNYEFMGSKREIYTQIGNAVPPLLAKAIAEEIRKYLIMK
ncbi:Modification methylase AplI [subsurface metagenome]